VGRLAPRASMTRITAGKGPLNTCQKAVLSLEKDCSYENSNSHSLTAPPTCQCQNSTLPYSPRFTPTQPTYGRSVKSWRDLSQANRCLSQSNAEKSLFDRPTLSTFRRNDNIGPSASHPTITTAPAPPRTPRPPHLTHAHPTPTHPPRTLPASPQPSPPFGPSASHPTISTAPAHPTHPTHSTLPTTTPPQPTVPRPSRTPRTPPHPHPPSPHAPHAPQ